MITGAWDDDLAINDIDKPLSFPPLTLALETSPLGGLDLSLQVSGRYGA